MSTVNVEQSIGDRINNRHKSCTVFHIGAIFAGYYLVKWLQIRPFGVIFLTLLSVWAFSAKCPGFQMCINRCVGNTLDQRSTELQRILQWRTERPKMFCIIVSAIMFALAIVGHIVSGSIVTVIGLMLIVPYASRRYLQHKTYCEYNVEQSTIQCRESPTKSLDHEFDELLPDVNESNLFVLEKASSDATISISLTSKHQTGSDSSDDDEKSDDIPSELLSGLTIPDVYEPSESSDDDISPIAGTTSAIEFKSHYFNGDSSSDDDLLKKNVQIGRTEVAEQADVKLPGFVSELVKWGVDTMIQHRISDAVQTLVDNRTLSDDLSSDSDFEIIDKDDFKAVT